MAGLPVRSSPRRPLWFRSQRVAKRSRCGCAGLALFMWMWTPPLLVAHVRRHPASGCSRRRSSSLARRAGHSPPWGRRGLAWTALRLMCGLNQCDRRRVCQVPVARYGPGAGRVREGLSGTIGRTEMGGGLPPSGDQGERQSLIHATLCRGTSSGCKHGAFATDRGFDCRDRNGTGRMGNAAPLHTARQGWR
jgi:hypothetical protein